MTRQRRLRLRVTGAVIGLGIATASPVPAHADEYCEPTSRPVASVLLIHGGGWNWGSAWNERPLCRALARRGFRARSLAYPLGTVPGSMAYADDAAAQESRRGAPVYAVGASAGGSVAEYLAVKSRIDGAVAVAPLSDFVNWRPPYRSFWESLGMTPEMRLRFSPLHNIEDPAPLRIVHSREDAIVPYEQSVRMVAACGASCDLVTLKLGLGHPSVGSWEPILSWLAQQAANPPAGAPRGRTPVLSLVGMRPTSFAVRPAAARSRPRRGATFRYRLSEAARVEFTIERELRSSGPMPCVWRPERTVGTALCSTMRRVGRFEVAAGFGENRTYMSGRIGGKALPPGRYRATLVAESRSRRRSRPQSLFFRIVRSAE